MLISIVERVGMEINAAAIIAGYIGDCKFDILLPGDLRSKKLYSNCGKLSVFYDPISFALFLCRGSYSVEMRQRSVLKEAIK